MPLKRRTPEERQAHELERAREREEAEKQRLWQAFLVSPAGHARAAFERGDKVFQYQIQVGSTQAIVIPMATARGIATSSDPSAILNSVANEGWDLINGSFAFLHLGSESRDKFMSSGQQVAVQGAVFGYYLFRRCEENRVSG